MVKEKYYNVSMTTILENFLLNIFGGQIYMQIEVVSARFNHGHSDYYFSPNGLKLKSGDKVIVDTEKGKDLVTITKANHKVDSTQNSRYSQKRDKKCERRRYSLGKRKCRKGKCTSWRCQGDCVIKWS